MNRPDQQNVNIDLGGFLEMLTLIGRACRETQEGICLQRQVDMAIEQSKQSIIAAGTAALAQFMNGARVATPGSMEDPAVHESSRLSGIVLMSLGNIIAGADALRPAHEAMKKAAGR